MFGCKKIYIYEETIFFLSKGQVEVPLKLHEVQLALDALF